MKNSRNVLLAVLSLSLFLSSCGATLDRNQNEQVVEKVSMDDAELSENQRLSRTFGHLLAKQLGRSEDFQLDIMEVAKGLQAELAEREAPMSESEYESRMAEIQQSIFDRKAQENLAIADKFLQENKKVSGVVEVQSGRLQYRIVKEGTGRVLSGKPTALLHYRGTFVDGQVFSSSENNKEPILLPLNQTIPGFALGMQGMKEGETRMLYIHPDLAYGTSGQLPPNSLLIFEIQLIQASDESVAAVEE